MKFLIVGCGGVGGYLAYRLKKAGENVSVVARGGHLEKIEKEGLQVKGVFNEVISLDRTFTTQTIEGSFDWVFFTTKVHQLSEALKEIDDSKWSIGSIATFQNGLEAHELVQERFPKTPVYGGIAFVDAYLDSPGSIQFLSKGRFGIGHEVAELKENVDILVQTFSKADLPLKKIENLRQKQWEKICWNLVFNPLSIMTGKTVGEIKEDFSIHGLAEQLLEEAYALAKHEGIRLPKSLTEDILSDQNAGSGNEDSRTSMHADFSSGRSTEIEFINGALVRLGKEYRIPTPANRSVVEIVHELERKRT